jgi:hypothetical protein
MNFLNNYLSAFPYKYLHFITFSLFSPIHQHGYRKKKKHVFSHVHEMYINLN